MKPSKIRQQIAGVAASLIRESPDLRHSEARRLAAERLCPAGLKPQDIPSVEEVDQQIQTQRQAARPPDWNSRFSRYAEFLRPLAEVQQHPERHPEGDALYHSLQVFQLAREQIAYDEELLTAALLHDIGKGINRRDHVATGLAALEGLITIRTIWFIENLPSAHDLSTGSLGARARRRLEAAEDFEELVLLAECDRRGRVRGTSVCDLEEAIDYLRELSSRHDPHECD